MSMTDLLTTQRRGVLATIKRDGRPQLSTVGFVFDAASNTIRISVTATRAKTRNLRRDPRASFYLSSADLNTYLVAEGRADLSAVAGDPQDATVDELVDIYRRLSGEHPDWAEYRQAMVDDQRLVVRLPIDHSYGWAQ